MKSQVLLPSSSSLTVTVSAVWPEGSWGWGGAGGLTQRGLGSTVALPMLGTDDLTIVGHLSQALEGQREFTAAGTA